MGGVKTIEQGRELVVLVQPVGRSFCRAVVQVCARACTTPGQGAGGGEGGVQGASKGGGGKLKRLR